MPPSKPSAIDALEYGDAGLAIRRLALPGAFAFLADQLLGIVDTIAIGSFGAASLAEITAASSVFLVFAIGFSGFSTGLRILGAQAIGAGRSDRFGTIVRSSMLAPMLAAIVLCVAFTAGSERLMALMVPAHASAGDAASYLIIRMWSLLPIVVTGQLLAAFSTAGDTKVALRTLVVINLVHLPLLAVLALGSLTHRPLGLTGAATSSLIAECVGAVYVVTQMRHRPEFAILSSRHIDFAVARRAAALSWPDLVFLLLQLAPEPIAVGLIAPAGAQTVAALRALILVNDATWAIPGPIGGACETLLGQRIGARDYAGARAFLNAARGVAVRVAVVVAGIVAILAWPLAALVTLSPALATVAFAPLAANIAITLPLKALAMVNSAPIRAAGDTGWVMRMGIVAALISTGGIVLGVVAFHAGLWSLPLGFAAAWIYRNVVTALRLRGGDWERRRLAA